MHRQMIFLLGLLLLAQPLWAEKLYVTDRILLGVHAAADRDSELLQSVPSGTSLKVLAQENGFKQVMLPDGTRGWVDAAFLVSEQPAPAQYDILLAKHGKLEKELAALREKLKKTEKELQVRRDQVSNAKTSLQELKKKLAQRQPVAAAADEQKLRQAEAEIETLKARIQSLEAAAKAPPAEVPEQQADSAALQEELAQLRARIEFALRSLQGEELPDAAALSTPPGLPGWYWGLLLLTLIGGIVGGIAIMDYRHRKRHGGFRV